MLPGFLIKLRKLSAAAYENVTNIFSRTNPGLRARLILAGLIALIFTAGVLQWSFMYGRLAYDVTYDDVDYFIDAYTRIKVLYEQGLGAMIAGLIQNPPHSPYSSLLAFAGFALFGPVDWAPYFMNVITICFFLGFIAYILRNINHIIAAVVVLIFLFVPLSFYMVHEFRPDFAVALFSCIFAFLAFESLLDRQNYDSFKLRCAGAAFGLALLVKPTFFAHTLALGFVVTVLIILRQVFVNYRQQKKNVKSMLHILKDFWLPGIILAMPYYALNWRHIWDYFWNATRGEQSIVWNFKGGYWEVIRAYLGSGASQWMLGTYLFFFLAIVIFSFLFFLHKRKWQDVYLLTGLMAVAAASFGIIVYGRHDNAYFGLTYQTMLCFASCYCLLSLYKNKLCFAFIVFGFIAFIGWQWHMAGPPFFSAYGSKTQLARKGYSANRKIIEAIERQVKEFDSNSAPIKVFFAFTGEVNETSASWLALQKSKPLQFSHLATNKDIVAYKKAISESDFVVVSDEDADTSVVYHWLPSFTLQKPVLDFLRMQPAMEEIMISKTRKDLVNGHIRLFANNSKLRQRDFNVNVQYPVIGFFPPEGPYPQWNLPIVRWGIFPESQIVLPDKLAGNIKLILSARSKPGTKLLLTLNEKEVYRHVFSGDAFEDIDTTISVTPGVKRLRFKYDGIYDNDKDKANRAVLFQDLRIIVP